ncbi:hypothetical protein [Streptomyces sp. HUAS TT20]|uniref:hypothetical protein n=1 Tax=Streptomyces sp. HUAS TT20 TaxID=3447509 RepID=UPI0021D89204|nr:hypothetical protein [Streptomyces sp. HUAS 15-9]UXY31582.1 hypothetical protein N8I87_36940 [Streptomyces sp. HUAS 15-9]
MIRPVPLGSPLQLLLLGCSFALAGYAGVRLLAGDWLGVTLWFVGAALLHDLVLLPLYSSADRAVVRGLDATDHRERAMYVRIPAALSLLLLLMWFPLISGRMDSTYQLAAGLSADGFLTRWLLITAVLFGGSASLLVLRLRRAAKHRSPGTH